MWFGQQVKPQDLENQDSLWGIKEENPQKTDKGWLRCCSHGVPCPHQNLTPRPATTLLTMQVAMIQHTASGKRYFLSRLCERMKV